ncbi:hypothetical protein Tco_0422783 [Tanacetum coccineum]
MLTLSLINTPPRLGHQGIKLCGVGLGILDGTSIGFSRKGLDGCGEGVFLEEKGEEFGFDSKIDEVVPNVEEVFVVDGVLEGASAGERDDVFCYRRWLEAMEEDEVEKYDEDDEENEEEVIII